MKSLILAASVAVLLASGAAYAGSEQPEDFSGLPAHSLVSSWKATPSGQSGPGKPPYRWQNVEAGQLLPLAGSNAPVETANSLPPGFENGTARAGVTQYAVAPAPAANMAASAAQPGHASGS